MLVEGSREGRRWERPLVAMGSIRAIQVLAWSVVLVARLCTFTKTIGFYTLIGRI